MTIPCWKWIRCSGFRMLEATCPHNVLTPDGDPCDGLIVTDKGEVYDSSGSGKLSLLPYRVKLFNRDCGCSVDVLIDKEQRVYWLNELCVREVK